MEDSLAYKLDYLSLQSAGGDEGEERAVPMRLDPFLVLRRRHRLRRVMRNGHRPQRSFLGPGREEVLRQAQRQGEEPQRISTEHISYKRNRNILNKCYY